jgi:hypothetical protein
MKYFILSAILAFATTVSYAQNGVNNLPPGKYETRTSIQDKSSLGDIILLNDRQYKTTSGVETGDYKFSVTAQRIFFTSGPLKGVYATTSVKVNTPVIVIPVTENASLNLNTEVTAYFKH